MKLASNARPGAPGPLRRWLLAIVVVFVAVSFAAALRSHIKSEAKKVREAAYPSALQAYPNNLKPGLTREEVEEYLRIRRHEIAQAPETVRHRRVKDCKEISQDGWMSLNAPQEAAGFSNASALSAARIPGL